MSRSSQNDRARPRRVAGPDGLSIELNANGSLRRMGCADIALNLFVGNELEGGPANLYLRRLGDSAAYTPLLGPRSPTQWSPNEEANAISGTGVWHGLRYVVALRLTASCSWSWQLSLTNESAEPQKVELLYAQDVALAPYDMVRLNEYYVSQYVDHTPLRHASRGVVVASRQNLTFGGRHPWCVIGSLRRGVSFATDAMQFHGLASRSGEMPPGLAELPERRLQHEHSMVVIRDEPMQLAAGAEASAGFFGHYVADHPAATSDTDLAVVDAAFALEAASASSPGMPQNVPAARSLFSDAPFIEALDLDKASCEALFGQERRHEEADSNGSLLSFFHGADRHVVLKAKELRVQRPHGHLLRTGRHLTPDESALTSTVWMSGVFHSMLTQGHVSFNRFLSTTRSYLGLFRSHGLRIFIEVDGAWQLLGVPSAFEIAPDECRWIYRHRRGVVEVRGSARSDPHALTLALDVREGGATRFLLSHHVALGGDDGGESAAIDCTREGNAVVVAPPAGSDVARRFPGGTFRIGFERGALETVGRDEVLFSDGVSRQQPYVCLVTAPATAVTLSIEGRLIAQGTGSNDIPTGSATDLPIPLNIAARADSPLAGDVGRLADIVPWFVHNALIHYLSPRGLEQFSGGGWGTRDVMQGPVELLLALGQSAPVRDVLLRVFAAQQPDGDWPQWFMFFERDANVRAGDSHGDIVFWPLLALAQYLLATGDRGLLDQSVRFFDPRGSDAGEQAPVSQHMERALAVSRRRTIRGTSLAAYGHGDWNDALQPADPSLREHMCSAWTVTLHRQVLVTLARALRLIGRAAQAAQLEASAADVQRDFQRLLLPDGVLAGYALFEDASDVRYLLHPRDATTDVRYSALAMIHAILEDMLTQAQAREHLRLLDTQLSGPDGVRLFDRPMAYHGGPQRLFQRAESATFFGREIGLMYMHAHLRYAQALAHVGDAEGFFRALCQANPIGIRGVVPSATLRQANCYYSSSDAAFADRYEASAGYERIRQGTISLDGGWRVYSSGAGIATSLIVRRFLGLNREVDAMLLDPVMPPALDGLRAQIEIAGRPVQIRYEVRGAGCGVNAVRCNDRALAFSRDPNPHRPGAARVALAVLLGSLKAADNVLTVSVG
jgi:cellobiose phosphorylase